jgi:hypothetical protein
VWKSIGICSYGSIAKNIKILTLITYVALCLLCFFQQVRSGTYAGKQLMRTSKLVKRVKICACPCALRFDLDDKTERVPAKCSYELKKRWVYCVLSIRYLYKLRSLDTSIGIATGYDLGSLPVRGKRFFSSLRPDWLWNPPCFLSNGYRGLLL